MTSNYELRKCSVDPQAAAAIFSQDFATKAFEQGLHKAKGRPKVDAERREMPLELRQWIAHHGRQQLATACLAYLFAVELQIERSTDRSFEGLIQQIQTGARQIAVAADTLADQLQRHHDETGSLEPVRYRALIELAAALNAEILSAEDLLPRREYGPFSGVAFRHGLQNCRRLADHADSFLDRYRAFAKMMRAEGKKALNMRPGKRTEVDRDAFVADLAAIYLSGIQEKPSAREGSETSAHAPSPFVRFVGYVFDEIEVKCFEFDISPCLKKPSADAVRGALLRASPLT